LGPYGIAYGQGRLSRGDHLGIDVNRAARIAAAGHGGQVVISDVTRGLVERLASMEGNHDHAMPIAGAGKRIREEVGGGAPPRLYTFEDPEPAAREGLGDEAIDHALQEGRVMELDQAVAYALGEGA
jgi:class 3 adenylate cyclase